MLVVIILGIREKGFRLMTSTVHMCPLCGFFSPSVQLHVSHYRLVHSKDLNFSVSCGIDGCVELFRSFSAYNSHVYRKHRAALGIKTRWGSADADATSDLNQPTAEMEIHSTPSENSPRELLETTRQTDTDLSQHSVNLPSDFSIQCKRNNAEFLMALAEGRQLSQQAISDVISGCRKICQQTARKVLESVEKPLADAGVDVSTTPGLMDAFLNIPDPFEGIDSSYLREKFYTEHMNYVVSIIATCNRFHCSYTCTCMW